LEMCAIEWPSAQIVWNDYNPHPQLASLPREIVFVSGNERDGFNPDQVASSGLQEVVTIFPGLLRSRTSGSGPEFIPLLRSGRQAGPILWNEVSQQSLMGVAPMNQRRRYFPSGEGYTLAARISGQAPAEAEDTPKEAEKKDAEKKDQKPRANLNVIAIADLDMI